MRYTDSLINTVLVYNFGWNQRYTTNWSKENSKNDQDSCYRTGYVEVCQPTPGAHWQPQSFLKMHWAEQDLAYNFMQDRVLWGELSINE